MYGDGLVVFGVFWVGLGYFEAVGFQKRNLAHYMYGDALGWFWVVWGVSMDRTTAMLTDQIRKRVCLALIGSPTDSRTVLPRAVGKPMIFGTPLVVRQRIKTSLSTA